MNSFKPFTGTKTSVVFLQKWGGDTGEPRENYSVFMATSQRSGKNNGGEYIFKTDEKSNQIDEDGVPVIESGRPAAIDHDLDGIADAFVKWGREQRFNFLAED